MKTNTVLDIRRLTCEAETSKNLDISDFGLETNLFDLLDGKGTLTDDG